ncbi:unnamed protein product [Mytilus coruscus]|uniref:SGNH hydrolase-type esterase domain-containing protein n=1 Tax=Mytilus coruscus TaxID=42192 RepID=A0A6J8CZH9_MYTCO|nr:unnamed protein product [Mytilus coruscus]
MLRRTARKRKAKGQEITLPRNTTTRAEILTTGHKTKTSMPRPPTFFDSYVYGWTNPFTQPTQPGSNPRQRPANAFMGHGAYPIRIKCLEACLVRINKEVKADAMLWLQFLDTFNGQCFSLKEFGYQMIFYSFSDSSGNQYLGCGAFFNVCVCKTRYELSLFKAAFSLAFHGLFRVGELVVTNSLQSHTLQLSDIHILSGLLQVGIPSSKTDQLGKGSNIWIYPQSDLMICPVKLVSIVGDPVNVWIVGSSIVKHAFVTARDRPGGVNLGLGRLNASFWWQGKGGMVVKHVKGQLRTMKKYEDPPHFLVLHVADIGSSKVGFLRNEIKNMIRWIMKEFPNSKLVWSQILTRLKWRHSNDRKAMDLCRYRINNSIAVFIISCGGYYIKHPDIHADQKFFQSDGVHLSSLGNELWLNILQGAMEHFIQKKDCASTFPC